MLDTYQAMTAEQFLDFAKKCKELGDVTTVAAGGFTVHFQPKPDSSMAEAAKAFASAIAFKANGLHSV